MKKAIMGFISFCLLISIVYIIPAENITNDTPVDNSTYKVIKVVDGDTIKIIFNDKEESLRLIGVDTPESVHSDKNKNTEFGKEASNFTKNYLEGKEITLEFDVQERDKYGRLLAYVYIDAEMFNKILLREGYAQVATFPPNVKYVDEFTKIQTEARNSNKGFWAYDYTQSDDNNSSMVYITSTGKKYHKENCQTVKNNKTSITLSEALGKKYTACTVCNP